MQFILGSEGALPIKEPENIVPKAEEESNDRSVENSATNSVSNSVSNSVVDSEESMSSKTEDVRIQYKITLCYFFSPI